MVPPIWFHALWECSQQPSHVLEASLDLRLSLRKQRVPRFQVGEQVWALQVLGHLFQFGHPGVQNVATPGKALADYPSADRFVGRSTTSCFRKKIGLVVMPHVFMPVQQVVQHLVPTPQRIHHLKPGSDAIRTPPSIANGYYRDLGGAYLLSCNLRELCPVTTRQGGILHGRLGSVQPDIVEMVPEWMVGREVALVGELELAVEEA